MLKKLPYADVMRSALDFCCLGLDCSKISVTDNDALSATNKLQLLQQYIKIFGVILFGQNFKIEISDIKTESEEYYGSFFTSVTAKVTTDIKDYKLPDSNEMFKIRSLCLLSITIYENLIGISNDSVKYNCCGFDEKDADENLCYVMDILKKIWKYFLDSNLNIKAEVCGSFMVSRSDNGVINKTNQFLSKVDHFFVNRFVVKLL